ncbi:MAG: thioredoxin [Methanobacteriota archaeon]|nr:MAG: thioredoxin [Euryarchaeota archaeon]
MDELEDIRRKKREELLERLRKREEARAPPEKPITINDLNFHDVVRRYPLVVIDCWAPWCAPCKIMDSVIKKMASEYAGKVVFGKLNIDQNRATALHYKVSSIPTLLIMKDGKEVDRIVGAVPKKAVEDRLQPYL